MPIKRKTNKVMNDKLNDMRPEPGPTHVDDAARRIQRDKKKLKCKPNGKKSCD